mmetsp:Transcript_74088/g.154511  ORF Transcript_74088/g.154511 Transcript_74088/m.154511 type:complete len:309 (+) Transcript_74088:231-1157(+)
MYTLATLEDNIPVMPSDFGEDFRVILKRLIQRKYVDKVVPDLGLCIEFYDFISFHEAIVYPGDGKGACGEAYHKVEFRLIIFRPAIDEWLVGSIVSSSEKGLMVSLGFYEAVEIPSANLRTPYSYDALQKLWVWQYVNPETQEVINFFYEKDELIRFRVISLDYGSGKLTSQGKQTNPMRLVGAVDLDGLGCVSWWPDCREEILDEELQMKKAEEDEKSKVKEKGEESKKEEEAPAAATAATAEASDTGDASKGEGENSKAEDGEVKEETADIKPRSKRRKMATSASASTSAKDASEEANAPGFFMGS